MLSSSVLILKRNNSAMLVSRKRNFISFMWHYMK
jgi:hypothetical protein